MVDKAQDAGFDVPQDRQPEAFVGPQIDPVRHALRGVLSAREEEVLLRMSLEDIPADQREFIAQKFLPDPQNPDSSDAGIDAVRAALEQSTAGRDDKFYVPFGAFGLPEGNQKLFFWTLTHISEVFLQLSEDEQPQLYNELLGALFFHPRILPFDLPKEIDYNEIHEHLDQFLFEVMLVSRARYRQSQDRLGLAMTDTLIAAMLQQFESSAWNHGVDVLKKIFNRLINIAGQAPMIAPDISEISRRRQEFLSKGNELLEEFEEDQLEEVPDEEDPEQDRVRRQEELQSVHRLIVALEPQLPAEETAWDDAISFIVAQSASNDVVSLSPSIDMRLRADGSLPFAIQWQCALVEELGAAGVREWGLSESRFLNYVGPIEDWLRTLGKTQDDLRSLIVQYLQLDHMADVRTWLQLPSETEPEDVTCSLDFLRSILSAKLAASATIEFLEPDRSDVPEGMSTEKFTAKPGKKLIFESGDTIESLERNPTVSFYRVRQWPTQTDYESRRDRINHSVAFGYAGFRIGQKRHVGAFQTSGMLLRDNPRYMALREELPKDHVRGLETNITHWLSTSRVTPMVVVTDEAEPSTEEFVGDPSEKETADPREKVLV